MLNIQTLRMMGYSTTAGGKIECFREGDRYKQEATAVICIDLEKDTRAGRDLIERLIAATDVPRAPVGRPRSGSAVLLFRCENPYSFVPQMAGGSAGVFELELRESGERFTLTIKSEGITVDVGSYLWTKGRSPVDVPRDALPVLTWDVSEVAVNAAFESAAYTPSAEETERERAFNERLAKYKAEVAAGLIKDPTPEEIQAAEDERLAASMPADTSWYDGILGGLAAEARRRIARRKAQSRATEQA